MSTDKTFSWEARKDTSVNSVNDTNQYSKELDNNDAGSPAVLLAGSSDPIDPRYLLNSTDDIVNATFWEKLNDDYINIYEGMIVYTKDDGYLRYFKGKSDINGIKYDDAVNLDNWQLLVLAKGVTEVIINNITGATSSSGVVTIKLNANNIPYNDTESVEHKIFELDKSVSDCSAIVQSFSAEAYSTFFRYGSLSGGSIPFEDLPTTNLVNGMVYNITNDFVTDKRFIEELKNYSEGTNVVYNGLLEKWDIMANQDISVVGNDIDE